MSERDEFGIPLIQPLTCEEKLAAALNRIKVLEAELAKPTAVKIVEKRSTEFENGIVFQELSTIRAIIDDLEARWR